jgi:Protein of unknown function (DUF2892)
MTCNLGGTERAIRVAIGMGLIGGALFVEPGWAVGVMSVIGGVAMLTGLIGFCPVWKLFGLNTWTVSSAARDQ